MSTSSTDSARQAATPTGGPNVGHGGARLATVRRLYFYLVTFVSFWAAFAGVDQLFRYLSEAWLADQSTSVIDSDFTRRMIAQNAGALLVAAPIFLIHWYFIRRRSHEADERTSPLRKFFIYFTLGVAVAYSLFTAYELIEWLARLAMGETLADSSLWPADWLHVLLTLALALLTQLYLFNVLQRDGDYGQERGLGGTWRRLFQTLAGLAGLSLLLQGSADLIQVAWQAATEQFVSIVSTGGDWWLYQLSSGIAMILLGAVVIQANRQRWRTIIGGSGDEATTSLRRFYLYAGLVICALVALIPGALILRRFLLIVLGGGDAALADLLDQLTEPISFFPVGVVAWIVYWGIVRDESNRYGESRQGATVRRLYYYAVAATGLVLVWIGAISVLQSIFDWLLVRDSTGDIWVDPLATGLSLLAVGAPVWALHWRTAQALARQPDEQGAQERASLPRRVYLYGVALAGALLILFYLVQVVYRILLLLLGDPDPNLFSSDTVNDLARSVIAALLWGVHLLAIRGDTQLGGGELLLPQASEVDPRAALEQRIAVLEQELAAARSALAELPPSP